MLNFICLVAQFYVALYPVGGPNLDVAAFFEAYLAGPFLVFLYLIWKTYSWFKYPEHRPLYVAIKDIDVYSGMRYGQATLVSGPGVSEDQRRASVIEIQEENKKNGVMGYAKAIVRSVF